MNEDPPEMYLSNISGANYSMQGVLRHILNAKDGEFMPPYMAELLCDFEITLKSQMQWINRMERMLERNYGNWTNDNRVQRRQE